MASAARDGPPPRLVDSLDAPFDVQAASSMVHAGSNDEFPPPLPPPTPQSSRHQVLSSPRGNNDMRETDEIESNENVSDENIMSSSSSARARMVRE